MLFSDRLQYVDYCCMICSLTWSTSNNRMCPDPANNPLLIIPSPKTFCKQRVKLCVILGFLRDIDGICALLGYHAAWSGNYVSTFRDNLSVPSQNSVDFNASICLRCELSHCLAEDRHVFSRNLTGVQTWCQTVCNKLLWIYRGPNNLSCTHSTPFTKHHAIAFYTLTCYLSGNQTYVKLRNRTVGLRQQVQHSHHAEIPIFSPQSHTKYTLVHNKSYSTYRLQLLLRKWRHPWKIQYISQKIGSQFQPTIRATKTTWKH